MIMYEARFRIDYQECEELEDRFLQEYNAINYHKSLQDYRHRASKMDMYPEDKLFFEMLCDIKKDLLEIKNLKKDEFIKLDNSTFSNSINYEYIRVEDSLKPNQTYYARLVLVDRTISCFVSAIDEYTFKITQIKRYDTEGLNLFVADIQRNLINIKKEKNGD
ncbi:hypothetical protein AVBRAN9334_00350 [Campylobacter sp. RM9334]|uniref:hypothetical protein n=2 Tax=Campylobacter TaxID=194 RepID=UPI001D9E4C17|nr:hypothetical protein [Campylobacter sp. RM9333]MBZ8006603.1 hypothetical protein [Campylobacter sp. RM9334]